MTKRKTNCCNDKYCMLPGWAGSSCLFCGANCSNCEVGDKIIQEQSKGSLIEDKEEKE